MFEPSAMIAIFPYAFIGAFPIAGIVIVTKWVIDDWRRSRSRRRQIQAS